MVSWPYLHYEGRTALVPMQQSIEPGVINWYTPAHESTFHFAGPAGRYHGNR